MKIEVIKSIHLEAEKNAKMILEYLAEIPRNESNINFIFGATDKKIAQDMGMSVEKIRETVEFLKIKELVRSIPIPDRANQSEFLQIEITDAGRKVYEERKINKK